MSNYSNAFEMAIRKIQQEIPQKILTMTFRKNRGYRDMRSLEAIIEQEVIREIVIPDINTYGGETIFINLADCTAIRDVSGTIYEIPRDKTGGRKITHATIATNMLSPELRKRNPINPLNASLGNAVNQAFPSNDLFDPVDVRVLGPGTIRIPVIHSTYPLTIKCQVDNDEYLNNTKPSSWINFSKLCVEAAKKHIYNELNLSIGDGSINGGYTDGRIRGVVDSFSSASEEYDNELRRWRSIAIQSNPISNRQRILSQLPRK